MLVDLMCKGKENIVKTHKNANVLFKVDKHKKVKEAFLKGPSFIVRRKTSSTLR